MRLHPIGQLDDIMPDMSAKENEQNLSLNKSWDSNSAESSIDPALLTPGSGISLKLVEPSFASRVYQSDTERWLEERVTIMEEQLEIGKRHIQELEISNGILRHKYTIASRTIEIKNSQLREAYKNYS